MLIISFLLSGLTLLAVESINPGFRIQTNLNGLNYAKSIGLNVLNKKVKGMHLPDVSGAPALPKMRHQMVGQIAPEFFSYQLTDIVINSFNAPNSGAHISLHPPSTIGLSASSLTAGVSAHYKVKVGSGWFSITKSGSVTASASSASFSQQLAVTQSGGKPHVNAGGCSANMGHLDITFHGDIIDDIINIFKSDIESYVKGKLNGVVCDQLKSVINNEANNELHGIPTSIPLTDGFNIDYSLTGNPAVDGNNGVVTPMLGRIWYTGHHDDAGYPHAVPMSSIQGSHRMVCLQLEAAEIIGSAGYASWVANILHLTLNKAFLDGYGLGKFLECQCGGSQCIGTFIPQITEKCNNGAYAEVVMTATSPPTANVNNSGAFIQFAGDLDFKAQWSNGKTVELFTAHVTLSTVIPSTLQFKGWKITGEIHVTGAYLTIKSSNIGQIDQAGLQEMWQLAILSVVEGELNKVTKAGIPLPNIPDMNVLSPALVFGDHTLTICADFQYTGPQ